MADDGNVKVFCRVRPPNEREGGVTAFTKKCVAVPASDPLQQTVLLQLKGMTAPAAPKTFTFDRVFGERATQNEVFELVGVPITRACLEGYNGTIFAYGQTGSGKTFTMQGPDDVIDADARSLTPSELGLRGLVPRVFDYLFQDSSSSAGALRVPVDGTRVEHTFACSFMEIYNERVYDLLDLGSTRDAAGLILRENGRKGVSVEGLIESVVNNAKQAAELMAIGARNRRVGQTAMNRESSRSHSVFVLQIQSKETTADGITRTRLSRFNLVDLAGSERQKNTEAIGERLKEAGSINKSLSALGNVIMGLVEQSAGKNRHVHYRDSKLTFLLKDSLGGNSKTFMIATISPAEDSSHETLSTLKFAQRAKLIRNNAVINEDTSGSVLVLQEEIIRLRRQLQEAQLSRASGSDLSAEARLASLQQTADGVIMQEAPLTELNERLTELESSLAFTLEKNESLLRFNGQLSVRSGRLESLCSELKRNIAQLKLRLRLRTGSCSDDVEMIEYESSADAIEWRMKYEELEEEYMELQERYRSLGVFEDQGTEVQKLNVMYLTLTKQLAHVIREKHEISQQLQDRPPFDEDDEDKLAQLEAELVSRSVEFEAKLNTVLAINAAAEEKAQSASLDLLQSKQKEAAWRINQQTSEIEITELHEQIARLQGEARDARESLLEEKRQRVELEMKMNQELVNAQQMYESHLSEKLTESFGLRQQCDKLEGELVMVVSERDHFSAELTFSQEQQLLTKEKLDSTSAALNAHVAELQTLRLEHQRYREDQDTRRQELESHLSESRSSNDGLESIKVTLERTVDGLEQEQATLCANVSKLEADVSIKKQEIEELQCLSSQNKAAIAVLENQCETFESELADHARVSSEKSARINELTRELHAMATSSTALTAELECATKLLSQTQATVVDLEGSKQTLGDDIARLQRVVSNLEGARDDLSAHLSEMSHRLTQQQDDNSALASRLIQTESDLQEEQAAHVETKDKLEASSVYLQQSRSENDNLKARVGDLEESSAALKDQLQSLNDELTKSSELLQITEDAVRECKAELAERTEDLETIIRTLKSEHADLNARMDATVARHAELVSQMKSEHLAVVEAFLQSAEKTKLEHEALVDTLNCKIEAAQARFEKNNAEHGALINSLQETLQSTEELLRNEKRLREEDNVRAKKQAEEVTHFHEDAVSTLTAAAEKQKYEDAAVIESLRKSVDVAQNTITERETTLSELRDQIASLQDNLDAAEATTKDYSTVIQKLQVERDELATRIDTLENTSATVRREKAAAEERIIELSADLNREENRVREHESTIAASQERMRSLHSQFEDITNARNQLAVDLQEARGAYDDALSSHETTVKHLQDAHAADVRQLTYEATATATKLETTVGSLQHEMDCLQNSIRDHSSTISQLEQQLASERAEKAATQDELTGVKSDLEDRERSIAEKNEAIDRLNVQMETLQEEATEQKVRLSGRIQLLETDLSDLRRSHTVLFASHETLTNLHTRIVAEKARSDKTAAEYEGRNGDLTKMVEDSNKQVKALSATIAGLEKDTHTQLNEISLLKKDLHESDKSILKLKQLVAKRDDEIDEKDSVISGMEETLENLESDKTRTAEDLKLMGVTVETARDELSRTNQLLDAEIKDKMIAHEKLAVMEADLSAALKSHGAIHKQLQHESESLKRELQTAAQAIASKEGDLQATSQQLAAALAEAGRLSSRNQDLEKKLQANEVAVQELVREKSDRENSLKKTIANMEEALQDVEAARGAADASVRAKSTELDECKKQLQSVHLELSEASTSISTLEQESVTQRTFWLETEATLQSSIQQLELLLEEQRSCSEQARKHAHDAQQSFEQDLQEVRQELEHSVEKASRQRKRNDTLNEVNAQLALEIEEKTVMIAENVKGINDFERELKDAHRREATAKDELLTTKSELSSTTRELAELTMKYEQLSMDFDSTKQDWEAKHAEWEAKDKELKGRMAVVGEMEVQIADESKKLTDEKVLVAQKKREVEKIKREYTQLKTRVEELEKLKIQLSKEKEKYRREVNMLTERLDNISKENDKLVGHDNKRQKIQHHIKVKEENNRLIEEVRQLTEQKFKLEVRVGKLELTLKEKENMVNDVLIDNPRSPSSVKSNASLRNGQQKLPQSAVPPSAIKAADAGPMEASAKKRLRSRIE